MSKDRKFDYKRLEDALSLDEMMQGDVWREAVQMGLTREGIAAAMNPGVSSSLIRGRACRDEVAADGIVIGRELIRLRRNLESLKTFVDNFPLVPPLVGMGSVEDRAKEMQATLSHTISLLLEGEEQ